MEPATATALPIVPAGSAFDQVLYVLFAIASFLVTAREFLQRIKGWRLLDAAIESVEVGLDRAVRCDECGKTAEPCPACRAMIKRAKLAMGSVARTKGVYEDLRREVKKVTEPERKVPDSGSLDASTASDIMSCLFWGALMVAAAILFTAILSSCRGPAAAYVEADKARRRSIGEPYLYHLLHCRDPIYLMLPDPAGGWTAVTRTAEVLEAGEADVAAWDRQIEQASKGE